MNEKQIREQFEADLQEFSRRYSLEKIKTESPNFIRSYRRDDAGLMRLETEKAIIRALGKTSRVTIGEGADYPDLESAEIGVREKWRVYFQGRRKRRTEKEKQGERRRQRAYYERRKARATEINRQQ